MEQRKDIYSEEQGAYTVPLLDQTPAQAMNSILWRLAVALDYVQEGDQGLVLVDPNEVLELAEDVIWLYRELAD